MTDPIERRTTTEVDEIRPAYTLNASCRVPPHDAYSKLSWRSNIRANEAAGTCPAGQGPYS